MPKYADYSTLTWARFMDKGVEVVARTGTQVAAGLVNEITPTHVRIGNRRLERKDIVVARAVARTHTT